MVEFLDGVEAGNNVFGRNFRQNVVDGVENKSAVFREDLATFKHMLADFFRRGMKSSR